MKSFSLNNQVESNPSTKVWNRGHATARLEEEMKRGQPDGGCNFSIILVQFEGLSDESARLGYAFADDMLRRASAVLTPEVGHQDLCCRLGGDDFLFIFCGRSRSECQAVIERLHQRWAAGSGARQSPIEMSVGVASFPDDGRTIESLLSAADESMQANKFQTELFPSAPEARAA